MSRTVKKTVKVTVNRDGKISRTSKTTRTHTKNKTTTQNSNPYTRRKPTIPRLILKILLAFLLGLFLMSFGLVFLDYANDSGYDKDEAQKVSMCDREYYAGRYGNLRSDMELYGLYSDIYGIYWEVVNGYEDYIEYQQWSKVSQEQMPEAAVQKEYYRNKIEENAHNCAYEKNRAVLERWAESVRQQETAATETTETETAEPETSEESTEAQTE